MKDLETPELDGLPSGEAAARLAAEGPNELPASKKRGVAAIVLEVFREPMFLLLVAAGMIYLFVGDAGDALMLLGFVVVIIGITLFQERRTERALEALRGLASPRALVVRSGEKKRIAGCDVVRGDVILISEGDRVPADALLISSSSLSVDESLLTGESVPVRKATGLQPGRKAVPGGEDQAYVFSGTLVVCGQGIARVTATGARTEMGRIGKVLGTLKPEPTPLQKEMRALVRTLAIVGAALCLLVIVLYGITRQDWTGGFLAGLALAMAILPEEFPVVLTVFLALGAWRISKKQVLTRRIPAVETLGSATVLCVDKTGTLTENRMSVRLLCRHDRFFTVEFLGEGHSLPEEFHPLVEFSILASKRNPFDPMEKAFRELGEATLRHTEHLHDSWELVQEYPLEAHLLAMSRVWRSPGGGDYVIAAKGSPEAILDLCHVGAAEAGRLIGQATAMAAQGLRVLGVARSAYFTDTSLPGGQHDFVFAFLGFIGLEDPVRREVPQAVRECYEAGIRVVMITGDYPETAKNIARQIGFRASDVVIPGARLNEQGDGNEADIFARVVPEQKLLIVRALKERGEVVAMTGDGVNDSPALKSADIGIAMGGRGTDVAREAASLVLLDDDFSSIVAAVRTGRRVYDNLRKAMSYLLAVHVPIAGMVFVPVALGLPLVLLPVHIVFLQLIIDPASSIVFEAEPAEPDVMRRPPRRMDEPIFGRRTIMLSFLQGSGVLVILVALYMLSLYLGSTPEKARTLTFTALIVANISLILTNRSWSRTAFRGTRGEGRNTALLVVVGCTFLFLGLVLYVPFFQRLFHFATLHPLDIALCLAAGGAGIVWFERLKVLHRVWKP